MYFGTFFPYWKIVGKYVYIYISYSIWAKYSDQPAGKSTLNDGLVRECPQDPLNSVLGMICPDSSYGRMSKKS